MTFVRPTKTATVSGDARAIVRRARCQYVAIVVDGTRFIEGLGLSAHHLLVVRRQIATVDPRPRRDGSRRR
jgi:hypothetical protein